MAHLGSHSQSAHLARPASPSPLLPPQARRCRGRPPHSSQQSLAPRSSLERPRRRRARAPSAADPRSCAGPQSAWDRRLRGPGGESRAAARRAAWPPPPRCRSLCSSRGRGAGQVGHPFPPLPSTKQEGPSRQSTPALSRPCVPILCPVPSPLEAHAPLPPFCAQPGSA